MSAQSISVTKPSLLLLICLFWVFLILQSINTGPQFKSEHQDEGSVLATETVDLQVQGNDDDAYEEDDNTSFSRTSFMVRMDGDTFASGATRYNGGHRFTSVAVPQGALINSATFEVYVYDSTDDLASADILADAVDNSVDFFANADVTSRARTSASTLWFAPGSGFGSGWEISPDISSVVQEIIDRPGWNSGNALTILVDGRSDVDTRDFESRSRDYNISTNYAAKLHITYTESFPDPPTIVGVGATPDGGYVNSVSDPTVRLRIRDSGPAGTYPNTYHWNQFQVYRDNGDGTFNAATDTLVQENFESQLPMVEANYPPGGEVETTYWIGGETSGQIFFWRARLNNSGSDFPTAPPDSISPWSSAWSFTVDNDAPTSTINQPSCDVASSPTSLAGTAADALSGVAQTAIAIQRQSDGFYWDWGASAWTNSGSPLWSYASGMTSWSIDTSGVAWSTGQDYTVFSSAEDNVIGDFNQESPPISQLFTVGTCDLQITDIIYVPVSDESNPAESGITISVNISVKNFGVLGISSPFDISFCWDSINDCAGTTLPPESVSRISADETKIVMFSFTAPTVTGLTNYTGKAKADSGEVVSESVEDNNDLLAAFSVIPEQPDACVVTTGGDVGAKGRIESCDQGEGSSGGGGTPTPGVVFFSGFEIDDSTGIGSVGAGAMGARTGGSDWVTSPVRSGNYAQRISAQVIIANAVPFTSTNTIGYRFAFRTTDATPTGSIFNFGELQDNAGIRNWRFTNLADGKVRVENFATGQDFVSANSVFSDNVWHLIEFKGTVDDANGSFGLRVDRVEVISQSGIDTNNSIAGIKKVFVDGPANGSGIDYYFDDVLVTNQDAYPGDGRVLLKTTDVTGIIPTTGDNIISGDWGNTAEIPIDQNSVEIAQYDGNPRSGTVSMNDFTEIAADDAINAVKVGAYVRRGSGSATTHFLRIREGGVDVDSTPLSLDTGLPFGYREMIINTKPSGGDWTTAALDTVEAGFGLSGAQDLDVDALYIQVDYSPTSGPPFVPTFYNAEYLVVADSTITNFYSAKDWLVKSYNGGINTGFTSGDEFDELWDQFGAGATSATNRVIPDARGIYAYPSAAAIESDREFPPEVVDFTWDGTGALSNADPVVLFINGNLNINANIDLDTSGKKVAFIVKGDVNVNSGVQNVDGFYVAGGSFNSGTSIVPLPAPESDVGRYTSIAIGSDEAPIIAYSDNANQALKFVKCGNANCSSGNTITTIDSVSKAEYKSIALGSDGFPVISYHDATGFGSNRKLKFVKCGNADCSSGNTITTIDDYGTHNSITIGTNGFPLITYTSGGPTPALKFAQCTGDGGDAGNTPCDSVGEWVTTAVESFGGTTAVNWPSIAVGTNGQPVISYNPKGDFRDLKFAQCTGDGGDAGNTPCDSTGEWVTTTVDSVGVVGGYSSIGICNDPNFPNTNCANNYPAIAYMDSDNTDLKFAQCTGDGGDAGNTPCDSTGEWVTTTVDSVGYIGISISLAIGTDGYPAVSYTRLNSVEYDLKFAQCTGDGGDAGNTPCDSTGEWVPTTVDSPDNVGLDNSIAIGGDGSPVISYWDLTSNDLKVAQETPGTGCSNFNWTCVRVDGQERDGDCPECQLTVNGGVIAFGGVNLGRNLGTSNTTDPAEIFNYDPSYLYIFATAPPGEKSLLGEDKGSFRELPP